MSIQSEPSQGFAEWSLNGPFRHGVVECRYGGSDRLTGVLEEQPSGDISCPPFKEFTLTANVGSRSIPIKIDMGFGALKANFLPESFGLCPAQQHLKVMAERPQRTLTLGLPAAQFAALLDTREDEVIEVLEPLFFSTHADPLILQTMRTIFQEMAINDNPGRLYIDGAMVTIAARLQRLAGTVRVGRLTTLSLDEKRLIADTIEDQLDSDLSLNRLAAVLNRSASNLNRAFKTGFGRSPYQYVLARRIMRAKKLLSETDDPITDIAHACGFSSQQHMTNIFTKRVGVSPARYRTDCKS